MQASLVGLIITNIMVLDSLCNYGTRDNSIEGYLYGGYTRPIMENQMETAVESQTEIWDLIRVLWGSRALVVQVKFGSG